MNYEVLEILQALRDDLKLLDEKIISCDTMDVVELIQYIENNLNELKSKF